LPEQTIVKTIYAEIGGMHCAACVQRVEDELQKTPGIIDASVNLVMNRATIYVEDAVDDRSIQDAIARAGYTPEAVYAERSRPAVDTSQARREESLESLRASLRLSIPLTVIVMATSMLAMIPGGHALLHHRWVDVLLLFLTVPVLWAGRSFFVTAVRGLRYRSLSMDSLVSLGTGTAFLYSAVTILAPDAVAGTQHHVGAYLDTTATIITLVLVGRFLETRAKGRAADALQRLMELRPPAARVLRDGQPSDVAIDDVVVGDLVMIRPGERIPLDGVIVEGYSTIDESMVTGESMPVERTINEHVIGGTLNGNGALVMRTSAVGADTVLAGIIAAVERAQGGKAPIQRLADRVSGIFVPAVMVIAVFTFVAWMIIGPADNTFAHAVQAAIAVLIIACPCALGLATPTAIVVGTGIAAERGILFGSAQSLEQFQQVDTVVLDKTGTLTVGAPRFIDVAYTSAASDIEPAQLWSIITSLERRSEHPVAKALSEPPATLSQAQIGAVTDLPVERSEAVVGKGTVGIVDGYRVRIGSEELMQDALLIIPADLSEAATSMAHAGATSVYVAVNGRVLAAIGVADTLRATSIDAVRSLRSRGIDVVLLTGDNQHVATSIAKQAGIDIVVANVHPDKKAMQIERLQHSGKCVAMVGDGINDAPALAQADVGIAMGGGADAAKAMADVTLVRDDLQALTIAIDISVKTMKTIRQNLFFAFAYNTLGIPIAAGLLYPLTGLMLSPMIAAAAMALSSVTVVTNALRLRRTFA
jgi:Cu+-exporting ATPase